MMELDPEAAKITGTWILPLAQRNLTMNGSTNDITPLSDGNNCWFLMTELLDNMGKTPGDDPAPWTIGKTFKGEISPCTVYFDGKSFGKFEAVPGLKENFDLMNLWYRYDDGNVLVELQDMKRFALARLSPK